MQWAGMLKWGNVWLNETVFNYTIPPLNGTSEPPKTCVQRCGPGFAGIKCSSCKKGFYKTSTGTCISCALFGDSASSKKIFVWMGWLAFASGTFGMWFYLAVRGKVTLLRVYQCECHWSEQEIKAKELQTENLRRIKAKHEADSKRLEEILSQSGKGHPMWL